MEQILVEKVLANEAPTSVLIVGLAIYIVRVIRRIEFDIHAASSGISDIKASISYLQGLQGLQAKAERLKHENNQ